MIPLQLPGGVSRALLLPVGSTFLLSSLPFCTPSRALSPPTSSPGRSPAEGAGQTPRQRTPAPGGGHLQFGVKVTELLVDPDIAVPALQPGLGPLILAAETPGLPVTGRRGDLPVLQDDGWARAPERHGRSGRTEGQGMEGRTTPRRLPWSLPRTPLPVPTRQLLQGHAALPVQSPELAVGLEAAGPSPDKGPAVRPPSRGNNSRWGRWQEPAPSTALGSDGSVPGS